MVSPYLSQVVRNDHLCPFGGKPGYTDHNKFVITGGDLSEMFEKGLLFSWLVRSKVFHHQVGSRDRAAAAHLCWADDPVDGGKEGQR